MFSCMFNEITMAGKNNKLENIAMKSVKEVNTPNAIVPPKEEAMNILKPQSNIKLV